MVVPGNVVIHQVCECLNDEDCHDGLWCNGSATCTDCVCIPGLLLPCDDGNECTVDPCKEPDPICGIIDCEEIGGICDVQYCDLSALIGPTSNCIMEPLCAGACGCTDDWDADGVDNAIDNCELIYNPDQSDVDGDGVGDICDNCPSDYNPDQRDDDSDRWGTVCDPEDDSDGIVAPPDNCPNDYNPDQEDTYPPQGNGIGDACDCESDFDCSGGVDANDVTAFLVDFGRNQFNNPCPGCVPEAWCMY